MHATLLDTNEGTAFVQSFSTESLWKLYWAYKSMLSTLDRYGKAVDPQLLNDARLALRDIESELSSRADAEIRQAMARANTKRGASLGISG